MYEVSPQFLEAIENGAEIVTRADLYRFGEKVRELPVINGSVSVDATAAVRRRCSLTLGGGDDLANYIPGRTYEEDAGLWPTGAEVKLFQGVRYTSGPDEVVPMGVFRLAKPQVTDEGDSISMTVEGYDRSRAIARAKFLTPYDLPGDQDLGTAIMLGLQFVAPWLTDLMFENFTPTDGSYGSRIVKTPGVIFDRGDDPWQRFSTMASDNGLELYFNSSGLPVLRELPDPLYDSPVYSYLPGEANILTSISRSLDDEEAYNGVVAIGNNSRLNTIPVAEAWDTNPHSPTYYDPDYPAASEYGPVPFFLTSEFITTDNQALWAARATLNSILGIVEGVSINAVPNFAHEARDIIGIQRDRINVSGVYVLDSFSVDLGVDGVLNGTTRKRSLNVTDE